MRVLHVFNYAWPYIDGYTVRSIGLITAQKKNLCIDAAIAVSPFPALAHARDEEFVTAEWGPTHQIQATAFDGAGAAQTVRGWERPAVGISPTTSALFERELDSIVTRLSPDLIHTHHPHYVATVALRVAQRKHLPAVYELRCINGDYDLDTRHPYYRTRGHWQNRLEYQLCREASAVVTISEGLADRLATRGTPRARLHVVRNSVNTDLFQPRADHAATPDRQRLRIGYATTFERIENLDAVVNAAAILKEKLGANRFEIVLAGTGRDWERIRALVAAQQLEDVVTLPGFVPFTQMPAFYQDLDLFLVPRRAAAVARDTTPLKPLEAIACGCPVIATDLPAMRELLQNRDDVKFVAPTAAAIAAALQSFCENPWPGRGGIGERSWSREIEKYRGVYEQALQQGPPQLRPLRSAREKVRRNWQRTDAVLRTAAKRVKLGAQDRGWLRSVGAKPLQTHIVVCGFPRSGSTLLQLLVEACVEDCNTFAGEVPALWAAQHANRDRPFMLTKLPDDIRRVADIRAKYTERRGRPKFIITLRDPRSVLTSRHQAYTAARGYYVEIARWQKIWDAFARQENDGDVCVVRYEDLVSRPDRVQEQLRTFIGWNVSHPFARYHERAERIRRDSMTEGALGGLRPLDATTLQRWQKPDHADRIRAVLREVPDFAAICQTLGYETDRQWTQQYENAGVRE